MTKRHEINWPEVWRKLAETMKAHNAPAEVIEDVEYVEWDCTDGKLNIFCPKALYEWIEIPESVGSDSNISYIKPILWPIMQRLGCKDLVYHII